MRWRIRTLLALALAVPPAAAIAIGAKLVHQAVRSALEGRLAAGELAALLRALDDSFLLLGSVALLVALFLTWLLGRMLSSPLRRLRADAASRAVATDFSPLPRSSIAEIQAVASAVDLLSTELRSGTQVAARERDDLAVLLNSVSEGIVQVGPHGRILHANPAAHALLHLPADAQGQTIAAVLRNAELRSVMERAARGQQVGVCEITVDDRRLLVTARPVAPGNGDAGPGDDRGGAVVTLADLTEVRRLEGVRRDFVANASHELKTPLTSIRGYAETLLTDELPAEMSRQFLEVIQQNAERLQSIVDDLLDLSRFESGSWRPQLQSVDTFAVAGEVWAGFRENADRKGIAFEKEGEDRAVMADAGGLRLVLSNLFDNALRYTPDGGRIRFIVRAAPRGTPGQAGPHGVRTNGSAPAAVPAAAGSPGVVVIEVRDTGTGIPRDALPRIFERFYRVDPARSRAEGGTGLGLSIVKHLMESMGGEVAAESELGKGTTVRLQLPAA